MPHHQNVNSSTFFVYPHYENDIQYGGFYECVKCGSKADFFAPADSALWMHTHSQPGLLGCHVVNRLAELTMENLRAA